MEERSQITQKIREIVADSLAMDMDKVQIESKLFSELDVTSLDFLDMIFALETEFGMEIRGREFDLITRADQPIDGMENGFTPEAIEVMTRWIPEIAGLAEPNKITPREFFDLMTVGSLVHIVDEKLRENGKEAS